MEYWMFWKKHARHGAFVVYVPFNLFLLLCLCHFAPTHPICVQHRNAKSKRLVAKKLYER